MKHDAVLGQRILIVDDNVDNVFIFRHFLEGAGYTAIEVVHDSRKALDRIRSFEPRLILLDLRMPHIDGLELLGQLRAEGNGVPVLIISAYAPAEARAQALRAGLTEFFESFSSMKDLTATVCRLIGPPD